MAVQFCLNTIIFSSTESFLYIADESVCGYLKPFCMPFYMLLSIVYAVQYIVQFPHRQYEENIPVFPAHVCIVLIGLYLITDILIFYWFIEQMYVSFTKLYSRATCALIYFLLSNTDSKYLNIKDYADFIECL